MRDVPYFVYAFLDPTTRTPVYIGITNNLKQRWIGHKSKLRVRERKGLPLSDFERWLKIHLTNGIEPEMYLIKQEPNEYEALKTETRYIQRLRDKYPLFNKQLYTDTPGSMRIVAAYQQALLDNFMRP